MPHHVVLLRWLAEVSVLRVGGQPVYVGYIFTSIFSGILAYCVLRTSPVTEQEGIILNVGPATGGWIDVIIVLFTVVIMMRVAGRRAILIKSTPEVRFILAASVIVLVSHGPMMPTLPQESQSAPFFAFVLLLSIAIILLLGIGRSDSHEGLKRPLSASIVMPTVFIFGLVSLWMIMAIWGAGPVESRVGPVVVGMVHFDIQSAGLGSLPMFPIHATDSRPSAVDVALELAAMTWALAVYSSCFVPKRIYDVMSPDQADIPESVAEAHSIIEGDISIEDDYPKELVKALEMVDRALIPGTWVPLEMREDLVTFRKDARGKLQQIDVARTREQAESLVNQINELNGQEHDLTDIDEIVQAHHHWEQLRDELLAFIEESEATVSEVGYEIAGAQHLLERHRGEIAEGMIQMIENGSTPTDNLVTILRSLVSILGSIEDDDINKGWLSHVSVDRLETGYRSAIRGVLDDLRVTEDETSWDPEATLDLVDTAMRHHRQLARAESHIELEWAYKARVTALAADQAMQLADEGRWEAFEEEVATVRIEYEKMRRDIAQLSDVYDELVTDLDEAVYAAIQRQYDQVYPTQSQADTEPISLDERVVDALTFGIEHAEGLPSGGSYHFPTRVEGTLEAVEVVVPTFDRLNRGITTTFDEVMDRWRRISDHPSVKPLRSWGTSPYPWYVTHRGVSSEIAPAVSNLEAQVRVMDQVINAVARAHRVGVSHGAIRLQMISFDTDSISSAQLGAWGVDRMREEPEWIHMQPTQAKTEDIRDLCVLWGELRAGNDPPGDGEGQAHQADDAIESLADSVDERAVDDGLDELRSLLPRP